MLNKSAPIRREIQFLSPLPPPKPQKPESWFLSRASSSPKKGGTTDRTKCRTKSGQLCQPSSKPKNVEAADHSIKLKWVWLSVCVCVVLGVSTLGVRVLSVTCLVVVWIVWQFFGSSEPKNSKPSTRDTHMHEKDECISNEDSQRQVRLRIPLRRIVFTKRSGL